MRRLINYGHDVLAIDFTSRCLLEFPRAVHAENPIRIKSNMSRLPQGSNPLQTIASCRLHPDAAAVLIVLFASALDIARVGRLASREC